MGIEEKTITFSYEAEDEFRFFNCGECNREFMVNANSLDEVHVRIEHVCEYLCRKVICPYCGTVMFIVKNA